MLKQELFNKYKNKLENAKADAENFKNEGKTVLRIKAQVKVVVLKEILNDLVDLTFPYPNS
ncbi:hypothetical protein ES703_110750 [subsurface metagenome]